MGEHALSRVVQLGLRAACSAAAAIIDAHACHDQAPQHAPLVQPMKRMRLGWRSRASVTTSLTNLLPCPGSSKRLTATAVPCEHACRESRMWVPLAPTNHPCNRQGGHHLGYEARTIHHKQTAHHPSHAYPPKTTIKQPLSSPHTCRGRPLQSRPLPAAAPPAPCAGRAPTRPAASRPLQT